FPPFGDAVIGPPGAADVLGDGVPARFERLDRSIGSAVEEDVREVIYLAQLGQQPQEQVVLLGASGVMQASCFLEQMAPHQLQAAGGVVGERGIGRPALLEDGAKVPVALE